MQSAATNALVRHRRDGWLLLPDDVESWTPEARHYLEAECEYAGLAPIEAVFDRLAKLVAAIEFSIVDVDRVVAGAGADRLKVDLFHLTAEGWRLVAEEVVRILEERGCFDSEDT